MMKKLLSVLLSAVLIFGCISVNAAIPENNGLGTPLTLTGVTKNISNTANSTGTNKNWLKTETVELTDTLFDSAFRITSIGTTAVPSTNQVRIMFDSPAMNAGDYVYVSFYYRALSECDGVTYENKPAAFGCPPFNKNSGNIKATNGKTNQSAENFDTWYKVSYIYALTSAVTEGSRYMQMGFLKPSASLPAYCMEVADAKVVYMGAVTEESNATQTEQITSQLSSTDISSISIGGTSIDLSANPTSYTTTDALAENDIAVTTSYGAADTVIIDKEESSTATQFTVKVYPPAADLTSASVLPARTYTIVSEKATAQFTENNGYGTGIINDNSTPSYVGALGRENNSVSVIEGAAAVGVPFDKIYNWQRKAFTIEGTYNTSYISFDSPTGKAAKKGDWVYVSFYCRINPNAPENTTARIFTSVRSNAQDNYLGSDSNNKSTYININSTEWTRKEYIQKLANDTDTSWSLKLSGPLTKDTEAGTVSGSYLNVDFADIQITYFGENTGNTDDENVIKETITQKLNTCGLTNVYVNGVEVKSSNPSKYEIYSPRYSAGVTQKVEMTGDTVYGAGTATVVKSKTEEDVYYVKSYAPAYDFLNPNSSLVAGYEVDVKYTYDFYVQDGKLYGVSPERDNMNGVVMVVLYSNDGNMAGIAGFKAFTLGSSPAEVIDIPAVTSDNYAKIFIFDGISGISPYIKAMTVTSEGITQ